MGVGMTRRVNRIIKRASVEPRKRHWKTLRSFCEKEWAMTPPQYAVSKWIGHSITVSGRHYANAVPDKLFDVASVVDGTGSEAQRQAQRAMRRSTRSMRRCSGWPRSGTICHRKCGLASWPWSRVWWGSDNSKQLG
jgi:hypothetical protein